VSGCRAVTVPPPPRPAPPLTSHSLPPPLHAPDVVLTSSRLRGWLLLRTPFAAGLTCLRTCQEPKCTTYGS
jgi:hypothetical protein